MIKNYLNFETPMPKASAYLIYQPGISPALPGCEVKVSIKPEIGLDRYRFV